MDALSDSTGKPKSGFATRLEEHSKDNKNRAANRCSAHIGGSPARWPVASRRFGTFQRTSTEHPNHHDSFNFP